MNEYVDVRGPWPIYFRGVYGVVITTKLDGSSADRSLTTTEARAIVEQLDWEASLDNRSRVTK
jgi:hypothetical protein